MYISIRDAMLVEAGFANLAAGLKQLGLTHCEIALGQDFTVYAMDSTEKIALQSDEDVAAYKKHLDGLGITACCFMTARDFSAGDVEESAAWVARALELAGLMGMSTIRIDSAMSRERELDFGARVDLFARGLGGALDHTQGLNVAMGIENHGFQGNNLAFLLNVFRLVKSDRLGSTLDTGNFYWRGYPLSEVYGILTLLAPHAKHTHCKNIHYPEETREQIREAGWEYGTYVCPLYEGDIDHGRVVRILAEAGYKEDVCIENESLRKWESAEERQKVLGREVAHLWEQIKSFG